MLKVGKVIKVTKYVEDKKIVKEIEKWKIAAFYPHCILLHKMVSEIKDNIIIEVENKNIRWCPNKWDLRKY